MKRKQYKGLPTYDLTTDQIKQKGWAVVNKFGYIDLYTVSGTRSDSIQRFEANSQHSWNSWYKLGWRCLKIEVISNP